MARYRFDSVSPGSWSARNSFKDGDPSFKFKSNTTGDFGVVLLRGFEGVVVSWPFSATGNSASVATISACISRSGDDTREGWILLGSARERLKAFSNA